jgi:hypothetical protein
LVVEEHSGERGFCALALNGVEPAFLQKHCREFQEISSSTINAIDFGRPSSMILSSPWFVFSCAEFQLASAVPYATGHTREGTRKLQWIEGSSKMGATHLIAPYALTVVLDIGNV